MNADLLCPDIVQLLTWAVHYPAEVERGLQTVEHPEALFGNDATVTALAGLLARATVTDVSRVLRCRATSVRVRWVAAMAGAEVTRRARSGLPPVDPPTDEEVRAAVGRVVAWQAAAVDYALDMEGRPVSVADAVTLGALMQRRDDLEAM